MHVYKAAAMQQVFNIEKQSMNQVLNIKTQANSQQLYTSIFAAKSSLVLPLFCFFHYCITALTICKVLYFWKTKLYLLLFLFLIKFAKK